MRPLLAVVALSTACASAPPRPTGPDADERATAEANVAWFEGKVAAACACTDGACLAAAHEEIAAWMPAHFGEARVDQAQQQRLAASMTQLHGCRAQPAATSPAPGSHTVAQALAELEALETRMCACKDQACVTAVTADMEATARKYVDTKAAESEMAEASAIVNRIMDCATRASGS